MTINVWEAVYFDHADHDKLLELARLAASVGVERYVLDDGWFGGAARRLAPGWATGPSPPTCGPRGSTRWSTP